MIFRHIILGIAFIAAFSSTGCGPNQRIIRSGEENPPANVFEQKVEPARTSFETDLGSMRTAGFEAIYVIRRKDDGPFDADDKRYLAANIPSEVNRREISDEGKALIIGTNFVLTSEILSAVRQRFDVQDVSVGQQTSGIDLKNEDRVR
ncbi:hypothetical protein [Leptolyngbya sp. 7M]|uniref:hypothetical protein n=1 Tax=Leptolyngbya sp. 7M TaxID=2812896 RepID=UPI001B8D07C6|nr:hypothetical protein [Leptolyngbya sp. 7M]QYO68252.1 hypothetical protein JVX88_16685 [Leptolyngbya sp. 7M]